MVEDTLLNYRHSSLLCENDGVQTLQLATAQNQQQNPIYFDGLMNKPLETARCLRAIADISSTRFYTPPAMLAKILREADPVITTSRQMLRFESFSACCSTYARLDVTEAGFSAKKMVPGTTNVDFQADMRSALSSVRQDAELALSVSADEFELSHQQESVIERKVTLPSRWIKGFSEVQAQQTGLIKRFEVPRLEAIQLLRLLPRGKSSRALWLQQHGKGLRLAYRGSGKAIKLIGSERLKTLERLVSLSDSLTIYSDDNDCLSAWILNIGPLRFTLVLSSEPWRGFSGEGKLLIALASSRNKACFAKVKSALHWQETINPTTLAGTLNESVKDVDTALMLLSANGLVGFDVYSQSYFHRVLPFDIELIDQRHPRLKSAKKLVEQAAVTLIKTKDSVSAEVSSDQVIHRVLISASGDKCSCPWYAKHQNERGPCKHILASYITMEQSK